MIIRWSSRKVPGVRYLTQRSELTPPQRCRRAESALAVRIAGAQREPFAVLYHFAKCRHDAGGRAPAFFD